MEKGWENTVRLLTEAEILIRAFVREAAVTGCKLQDEEDWLARVAEHWGEREQEWTIDLVEEWPREQANQVN